MELDAFDGKFAVAEAHDDAIIGLRSDGQFARERLSLDDQRVIARCGKRIGQLPEDAFAVVMDFAGLAVEKFGRADDFPAERNSDRLMPQANA